MSNSARLSKTYATAAGNIDCIADGGGLCAAIRVNVAGNVEVEYSGAVTDIVPMTAGEMLPLAARRILAASTTATGITVMWGGET